MVHYVQSCHENKTILIHPKIAPFVTGKSKRDRIKSKIKSKIESNHDRDGRPCILVHDDHPC